MNLTRINRPPLHIQVGEELTTCLYCETRTETVGEVTDEGHHVDFCPTCGQNYIIESVED